MWLVDRGDHDFPFCVTGFEMPDGLGNLTQSISSIDNGRDVSGFVAMHPGERENERLPTTEGKCGTVAMALGGAIARCR